MLDLSSTGVEASRAAKTWEQRGVNFIDSPVSVGVDGATNAALAVMPAGDKARFHVWKCCCPFIGNVFVVGEEVGHGQTMKLFNNFLSATAVNRRVGSLLARGAGRAGCEHHGAGRECVVGGEKRDQSAVPQVGAHRHVRCGVRDGIAEKDVRLFNEEANREGLQLPVSQLILTSLKDAVADLNAGADISDVSRIYEHQGKREIRG